MELWIGRGQGDAAWPLAFRAALALVAGIAVGAWAAVDPAHDAPRTVVQGAWDPGTVRAACANGCFACSAVGAILARQRWVRSLLAIAACTAAGFAFAGMDSVRAQGSMDPGSDGPVTLLGTVATAPRIDDGGTDLLGGCAIREAAQTFELEVDAALREGAAEPWNMVLMVRVAGLAPLPPRGTPVRVRGWFRAARGIANPGKSARRSTGTVEVPSATLVAPTATDPFQAGLIAVRCAANDALLRAQPHWVRPETTALVAAMTTGVRHPGLTAESAAFRAAGMSHVLAISGFNVAVLVAGAGVAAAAMGAGWRIRALLSVAVAAGFLAITEPDTSVVRAGLGAALAATASLRGGQARGLGTLGLVAIATLLFAPDDAARPGFQLSYGVVVGLLAVAPTVAVRWTGRIDGWWAAIPTARPMGGEPAAILRRMAVGACAASMVAWTVSMPIAAWHAGTANMWAAPLSIVTMPAAALTTISGVASILLADILPPVGEVAGGVAAACADLLRLTAHAAANAPGGTVRVGSVPWWMAAAFGVAVLGAWMAPARSARLACWASLGAIGLVALDGRWTAVAPSPPPGTVSVESLAVGKGSCRLVRTADSTVVFDAGSNGSTSIGTRVIVPAIAALGIRRIDACVLGSRSLSSCSGMPEAMASFGAPCMVASRACLASMERAHDGHGRMLLEAASDLGVRRVALDDGDVLHVGSLVLEAHVPPAGPRADRPVESMVLGVRHRDWPPSTPSLVVSSDPRHAAALDLATGPEPTDAAVRIARDASGRTFTQGWTAQGWR